MRSPWLTLAAAISLLLFAATTVLSIRSRGHWDFADWHQSVAVEGDSRVWILESTYRGVGLELVMFHRMLYGMKARVDYFSAAMDVAAQQDNFRLADSVYRVSRTGALVKQWDLAGFAYRSAFISNRSGSLLSLARIGRVNSRKLIIPWWALFATFLIVPVGREFRKIRLRSRPKQGMCRACDYDLTGNTSGICPECGAACKAADPAGVSPAAGD